MYRFFVEPEQVQMEEKQIIIVGGDVNHIKNVLRMKPGEEVSVSDESGREYICTLTNLEAEKVIAQILYVQENGLELPARISLYQSLPKNGKMEWIIQKTVELGVAEIIPVVTKRAVVKLDARKEEGKRKRWQGVAESAAKQSKRLVIPPVQPVMDFRSAVDRAALADIPLIPYEMAGDMEKTRQVFSNIRPGTSAAVFIGPEGGFAPEEVEYALSKGIQPITLGKRILRTETAGMTVMSILMYLLEGQDKATGDRSGRLETGKG